MALSRWFYTIFPGLRQIFTRGWYEFISTRIKDDSLLLMNHGYVDLDADAEPLELPPPKTNNTVIPFNFTITWLAPSTGLG